MRRQMKKLMEQNNDDTVDQDLVKQIANIEASKKQKQIFQNIDNSDSDQEQQQQQKQQQEIEDQTFLDTLVQQQQQQQEQQDLQSINQLSQNGPLHINIPRLNYNKELKQYFKNAKLTENGKQQKKQKNQKPVYLTYNPSLQVPLPDKFNCQFTNLNDYGFQQFSINASQSYERLQKEYMGVKNTYDPQAIFDFLSLYPFHCEALFDVSEYFRIKGDYKQANEILERILYIYEASLGYQFHKFFEESYPTFELEENAHSKVFMMALFKFTDVLCRKGCYKAALEFSKVLLKLSPTQDPTGVLLLIDHYSLLAQQYDYLLEFTMQYASTVFKNKRQSLVFMPNYIYNCALAKFLQAVKNKEQLYDFTQNDLEAALKNFGADPLKANHKVLILQAILLYPIVLFSLATANEYVKQTIPNSDTYIDNQRKPFKELLQEDFLQRETYLYWFLQLESEDDTDGFKKILTIFVEKSQKNWKQSEVMQWVKGALGLIVNAKLDLNTFYEDQSVVNDNETFNEIPFQFRRYKDLLKSHFQENPERLDFNNIFAENIGAQQQQQQMPQNFNPLNQNNGILDAIFGTLLPWVHNPNAQ